jgi:hypothetical protein
VLATPSGSVTATEMNALAEFIRSMFAATFVTGMSDQVVHQAVVASYSFGDGTFAEGVATNPVIGGDVGAYCDGATSFLVSWRLSAVWRGGHPRSYFPGVVQDRLADPNTFTSSTVSEWQGHADNYLSDINGGTPTGWSALALGVLRRLSGGAPLVPPEFVPFTGALMRVVPGTQRRRLRG